MVKNVLWSSKRRIRKNIHFVCFFHSPNPKIKGFCMCVFVCVQVDEIYSVPDVGTVVGGTLYR